MIFQNKSYMYMNNKLKIILVSYKILKVFIKKLRLK